MSSLKLDKKKILEYQKNRDPYLMIDYAEEVVPGISAKGFKLLKKKEWFFKVHWQGDPNMPGMLQTEALIQMSALIIQTLPGYKGKTLYLVNANDLRYFRKILPGDKLEIFSKLISWKRNLIKFQAEGYVSKKITCNASFTLVIPGSINININKKI
jgi:3-hydroxyacyl-[acyl-carrier-protein] dehydratase